MIPATPRELLTDPMALRAVMRRIAALRRLELAVRANGELSRGALMTAGSRGVLSVSFTIPTGPSLDQETIAWRDRATAIGGTFLDDSIAIADALIRQIKAASFNDKIVYLLPLLGGNLAAARVPLRDSLNVGAAGNTGFANSDFSQATGLKGDGSSKRLDLGIKPSQVGTSNNGGIGYWENDLDNSGTGVEPIGCYSNNDINRYVIDLRSTARWFFWGWPGNGHGGQTIAPVNAHYYGQRSSATLRKLYQNGSALPDTSTVNDSASGASDQNFNLMGVLGGSHGWSYWKGRCAVAYLTSGDLSEAEISELHTLLSDYLITPTGR